MVPHHTTVLYCEGQASERLLRHYIYRGDRRFINLRYIYLAPKFTRKFIRTIRLTYFHFSTSATDIHKNHADHDGSTIGPPVDCRSAC
jgi:hypothetical protein